MKGVAIAVVLVLAVALLWERPEEVRSVPEVTASQVILDDPALGVPVRLELAGHQLIVINRVGPHFVHAVDLDGTLIDSFGREGDGPGEYRGAGSIDPFADGSFAIHDVRLQRRTLYDGGEPEILRYANALVLEAVETADGFIATGMFDGRLGHFTDAGELERESGSLPTEPESIGQTMGVQASIRMSPSRDRFALLPRYYSQLEIFDARGAKTATATPDLPMQIAPTVQETPNGPRLSPGSLIAYADISVTDERIYALFSGSRSSFGRKVYVFDWTGVHLETITLDFDALAIAVWKDRRLYAIAHEPVPAIRMAGL